MMLPSHWWFGLIGPARDVTALFRRPNVFGGHVATLRRLLRIGPFAFYVVRYRPGHVEDNSWAARVLAAGNLTLEPGILCANPYCEEPECPGCDRIPCSCERLDGVCARHVAS
jgi:hypothetical protein